MIILTNIRKGNLVWFTHNDGHRWRTRDTKLIIDFFKKNKKQ